MASQKEARERRLAELRGLDRWAFEPRRVESRGVGANLADTELYVGKILWVRAGSRSASSSTTTRTRAGTSRAARRPRAGDAGQGVLNTR